MPVFDRGIASHARQPFAGNPTTATGSLGNLAPVDLWDRRSKLRKIIIGWACMALVAFSPMANAEEPTIALAAPSYLSSARHLKTGPLGKKGDGRLTAYSNAAASINERPNRLFRMDTEPVGATELTDRWQSLMAIMIRQFATVERCRLDGSCSVPAQRLIEISAEGAIRSGRARIGLINRAANLAIRPMSDEKQWGVVDHWSDPFETLLSSNGDCEDYAIVKYAALLEAGVPAEDIKIVILKKRFPNEYHAVTAARVDGEWLILDNRTLTLVRDTDISRAIPVFVLDHEGIRRFIHQGWPEKIATATIANRAF